MTVELINLELDEVSLVDNGDDPLAKVAIFKRKPQEGNMDETEIQELTDQVAKAQADIEALKIENEKLRKYLLEEGYTIRSEGVEKKAPEEMVEIEGEMIVKSSIPAPILKKLVEMEKAAEVSRLEKRAKDTLPHLRGTDLQKGLLLKALDSVGGSDELLQILKAADALFAKASDEIGRSTNDGDMLSPADKLEKMVKEIQKQNNWTFAKAYQEVAKTKEGKALIQATYKEKGE